MMLTRRYAFSAIVLFLLLLPRGVFSQSLDSHSFDLPLDRQSTSTAGAAEDRRDRHPISGHQAITTSPTPRNTWKRLSRGYFLDGTEIRHGVVLQLKRQSANGNLERFDVRTFEPLGCGFLRDTTGVYMSKYDDDVVEHNETDEKDRVVNVFDRLELVDKDSFQVLEEGIAECRAIDKDFVYAASGYEPDGGMMADFRSMTVVETRGDAYLEKLNCNFIKTAKGVFWFEMKVHDADRDSFHVLTKRNECAPGGYAKDRSHIFWAKMVLSEADYDSFTVLDGVGHSAFAFDKHHRYQQGSIIDDPNPDLHDPEFEKALREWKAKNP
jgi:hypothetical protein